MSSYVVKLDGLFDALQQEKFTEAKSFAPEAEKEVEYLENNLKLFSSPGKTAVPLLRRMIELVKQTQFISAKEALKNEDMKTGYHHHLQGHLKDDKYKSCRRETILSTNQDYGQGPNLDGFQHTNKGGQYEANVAKPTQSTEQRQFANQGNHSIYPNFKKSDVDPREADSLEKENRASNAMSRNNPDIADLSDMNRPTKLAEKFSELYDNEWTEAFDSLNTLKRATEKKIIEELLLIVQDAYDFCKTEADKQIQAMCLECLKVIGGKDINTETKQTETEKSLMMEFRKANAELALPRLENDFFNKQIRNRMGNPPVSKTDPLAKYAKKAIEITWLMNVQVPPVYMCPTDEPFDSNLYRAYTKSGKVRDFFVWPALRLYKEGGVLVKGVIQFK